MKLAFRGASTRACRAGTHPGAWRPYAGARPGVIFRSCDQPSFYRIVFDVDSDSLFFLPIADPVIVGFRLPETLPRPAKNSISFTRTCAFERTQQFIRRHFRQQQHVNVIRHDCVGSQLVMAQFHSAVQGCHNDLSYFGLPQIKRAARGVIEVAVHPYECFAIRYFVRRRITALWKAAVQTPCHEQLFAWRVNVGKAPVLHVLQVETWRRDSHTNRRGHPPGPVPARQARVLAPRMQP